jgi:hypothetical protein
MLGSVLVDEAASFGFGALISHFIRMLAETWNGPRTLLEALRLPSIAT